MFQPPRMRSQGLSLMLILLTGNATLALGQASWDEPQAPRHRSRPPAPTVHNRTAPPAKTHRTAQPQMTPRPSRRGDHLPAHLYSVMLDAPVDPIYRYRLGIVSSADVEGRSSGLYELDADHEMAYFRNVLRGDIDIGLALHSSIFTRKLSDRFPRTLFRTALDTGWTWRYLDGKSLELRAAPGLYGAVDASLGSLAAIPFQIRLHQAIHPDLAGMVGVEIRPGWDRALMPLGGIVWEPDPTFRAEVMLPRSRALLFLWRATLFANAEWRNWSYGIKAQDDYQAKQLTLNDYAISLGAGWRFTDEIEFTLEAGRLIGRTLDTDSSRDPRLDADSANFIRIGLLGPF